MKKRKTIEMPASVWRRAAAFVIDLLILDIVIMFPFRKLLTAVPAGSIAETAEFFQQNPELMDSLYTAVIVIGVLSLLYFTIMEYKFHQTLGKMLMNLYVTEEMTFWQALARNLFLLPFLPFILLWVVEPLYILFTKEHQRLLEILTKTNLIERHQI